MFLLRKSNFIMINELKYGQTWKIAPSSLSLSLYSTFNASAFLQFPIKRIKFSQRNIFLFFPQFRNKKYVFI